MPEFLDRRAIQATMNNPADQIGYGLASAPTPSYDQPDQIARPEESLFHPVRAVNDIIAAIDRLYGQLSLLNKENERQRNFKDTAVQIGGALLNWPIDYQERRYVYALAPSAITLVPSTGGTVALTANQWSEISLPRGTTFVIQGGSDAAPTTVWIRACDFKL